MALLGLAIITLLGIVFLCICCVEPNEETCMGRTVLFIAVDVPSSLLAAYRCVIPLCLRRCVGGCVTWVMWKPNPLLQMLYATLVGGGMVVLVADGFPLLPNRYLGEWHRVAGCFAWFICLYTWYKICSTSPGVITAANVATFDNYAYDGSVYRRDAAKPYTYPDEEGRPDVPKLARSKHCRVMDVVVSRFDHFCPWVNNAVGEQNYRWFLAFLAANSWMLSYGALLVVALLLGIVDDEKLMSQRFRGPDGVIFKANYTVVFQYLLAKRSRLVMLMSLCGIMAFVVTGFLLWHLYLVASGMTTNEQFKWSDAAETWREALDDARGDVNAVKSELKTLDAIVPQSAAERTLIAKKRSLLVKAQVVREKQCALVVDAEPLNIYNLGFSTNLLEVFFPRSLHQEFWREKDVKAKAKVAAAGAAGAAGAAAAAKKDS